MTDKQLVKFRLFLVQCCDYFIRRDMHGKHLIRRCVCKCAQRLKRLIKPGYNHSPQHIAVRRLLEQIVCSVQLSPPKSSGPDVKPLKCSHSGTVGRFLKKTTNSLEEWLSMKAMAKLQHTGFLIVLLKISRNSLEECLSDKAADLSEWIKYDNGMALGM
jgi:hypothetical protein